MKNEIVSIVSLSINNDSIIIYLQDGSHRILNKKQYDTTYIIKTFIEHTQYSNQPLEIILPKNNTTLSNAIILLEKILNKNIFLFKEYEKEFSTVISTLKKENHTDTVTDIGSVMVLEDYENTTFIPNIHKIEDYILNGFLNKNMKGVAALIKKLSTMEKTRNFVVQDVLDFLATAKLPLTDNGNIIFLKSVFKDSTDTYVDCHTRSIEQRAKTRVSMKESLVNNDREISCSEGLHVASIEYASSFSGNTLILGMVKPENIIAVPEKDHTKIRVSEYDIHCVLSNIDRSLIQKTKTLTGCSPELTAQVNQLIKDGYVAIEYTNEIIDGTISNLKKTETDREDSTTKDITKIKEIDKNIVNNTITKKAIKMTNLQRVQKYFELFKNTNDYFTKKDLANQIIWIKRRSKKPWASFGLSEEQGKLILKYD